jgi:hypothetical protein
MKCHHCPVPDGEECRKDLFPWFCGYAGTGHPIRLKVVLNRSRIANSPQDTHGIVQDATGSTLAVRMLDDPVEHQKVYDEAMGCLHRKTVQACCGPVVKCGPGGQNQGRVVQIMDCYGCVLNRKGGG